MCNDKSAPLEKLLLRESTFHLIYDSVNDLKIAHFVPTTPRYWQNVVNIGIVWLKFKAS